MAYDGTKPAGTDTIASSDDYILANFVQIVANLTNAHAWSNDTATDFKHKLAVGSLNRELDSVGADVATTGVGFKPTAVFFFATGGTTTDADMQSFGGHDGTNDSCVCSNATDHYKSDSYCIFFAETSFSNYQRAVIKTLDADGFTLTWSTANMVSTAEQGKIFYVCII